jgi:hypothetical protein
MLDNRANLTARLTSDEDRPNERVCDNIRKTISCTTSNQLPICSHLQARSHDACISSTHIKRQFDGLFVSK